MVVFSSHFLSETILVLRKGRMGSGRGAAARGWLHLGTAAKSSKRLVFAAFVNILLDAISISGDSQENADEKNDALQQFQPAARRRNAEPGQTCVLLRSH
jgi:hypothetical protein